jgi:nitroreductase
MEFEKIVMNRHAAKSFDGRHIPEEQVRKLLEIIRHAPSSYNIQPWKIYVVSKKEMKDALATAAYNQPQVSTASHVLVFAANADVNSSIDLLEKNGASGAYVKLMRDFAAKLSPEEQKSWAQRQLYLVLSNAINGAESLGFDSCPMEGFDPAAVAKLLDMPKNIIPTALCPIGYANDSPRAKIRHAYGDVFVRD